MNLYNNILLVFFLYSTVPIYPFFPQLLQRITGIQLFHGVINNSILGGLFYLLYQQGESVKTASSNFASQAKPWDSAPEYLKKYNPHIFFAGTIPCSAMEPEQSQAASLVIPSMRPDRDIYLINDKTLLNHKLIFDFESGKISEYALFSAILFEYERKSMTIDPSEYAPESFLHGVMNFILLKHGAKYILRLLPPSFRKTHDVSEKIGKIPYIAGTSILDLIFKYYAGMWNFVSTQIKKYQKSRHEVAVSWTENAKTNPGMQSFINGYLEYREYRKKRTQKS